MTPPVNIDPAQVLLERRKIRRSFEAWCRYRMGKVGREPALHHLLIINTIEKLLRGELPKRNVMLLMPPGAAKSTYTSILLPAWFLNPSQYPTDLMLACSYSYDLIERFGKQARDIIEEESNILGINVSKSFSAAGDWRTGRNGGYFCAGVKAGIAGHRARLGFIDDYIGSQEDADSQRERDKVWLWYWNDFWPRLLPNAWQFIIANWRHEDDLVGRMLTSYANDWHVIRIPMEAEQNDVLGRAPGERLWPEWFTAEQVATAKRNTRVWAGLYQQRPAPEEGNYFRRDWIVEYTPDQLPSDLRVYVGADYAVRKGEDNDRFCYLPAGVDTNGRIWILPNWFWETADTDVAVEKQLDMIARFKPLMWFAGRENITGSIGPFLRKRMIERNTFCVIEEFSESKDKEQKAQPIRGRMAQKMVMFPKYAPDWDKALHQILTFPAGSNDDFVDALAKVGQGIDLTVPAQPSPSQWNGYVPDQRITCGWVQRSHQRRQRELVKDFRL